MPRIALLQSSFKDDFTKQIKAAASRGANIVCLPELFHTPYFCRTEDWDNFELAISKDDPIIQDFTLLAKELDVVLVVPYFERRAKGVYHNTAAVIDADGSVLGHYRKMHIPDDPCFYEKFYFTPGDTEPGYCCFETKYGKVGVLICWDQWFPEAARATALLGADILFYPTAIGWLEEEKSEHGEHQVQAWKTMQKSHAISNGVFVAACNRVGVEHEIEFFGESFACSPFGVELCSAKQDKEILLFEADFNQIDKTRTTWPFLRDRRIDSYQSLLKRLNDA